MTYESSVILFCTARESAPGLLRTPDDQLALVSRFHGGPGTGNRAPRIDYRLTEGDQNAHREHCSPSNAAGAVNQDDLAGQQPGRDVEDELPKTSAVAGRFPIGNFEV